MTCSTINGDDCSLLEGEQLVDCRCDDDCVRELIYRYTGDSATSISITNDGTVYFDGFVQFGDDLVIRDQGECLPSALDVTVRSSDNATQTVFIESTCSGATLLENFGSLVEFAGYTCADNIPHNCYIDVEFSITTSNAGTVPQTVTDWSFDINGETRGPGIALPTILPNEGFSTIEAAEIELCTDMQYVVGTEVAAIGSADLAQCEAADSISFDITQGSSYPSPSPSESPTSGMYGGVIYLHHNSYDFCS